MKKPYVGSPDLEVALSDERDLKVGKYEWKYGEKGRAGSYVVCLGQSSSSSQPSRIEPLFVPHQIDFILPLGNDQRYTQFVSKCFWVPWYRSDKQEEYEVPGKGVCARVELAQLPKDYLICFKEALEIPSDEGGRREEASHSENSNFCNNDLRLFLSILTGWNLVIVFPAVDVKPDKRRFPFKKSPRPADVFCFRKEQETRIAIRRKYPGEEGTMDWTSATLVEKVHVETKTQTLYLKFRSRQTGRKLNLPTVTAAEGETDPEMDKIETWAITVASGSGDIFATINVRLISGYLTDTYLRSSIVTRTLLTIHLF